MKKIFKKFNHTLFDVSVAPMYLTIIGIPLLLIIAVIIIAIITCKLIGKAMKNKKSNFDNDNSKEKDK